jgi:hypothetical protein
MSTRLGRLLSGSLFVCIVLVLVVASNASYKNGRRMVVQGSGMGKMPCLSVGNTGPGRNVASEGLVVSAEELLVRVAHLKDKLEDQSLSDETHQTVEEEFEAYWAALAGRGVDNWQGWVVKVGQDVQGSIRSWAYDPYNVQATSNSILITLFDPNVTPVPSPTSEIPGFFRRVPPIYVHLEHASSFDSSNSVYCIGDKVAFSGTINLAPTHYRDYGVSLSGTKISMLEKRPAKASLPSIPDDLQVTLSRGACFGLCPIYSVTLYSDGTVLFEGQRHTKVLGFQFGQIEEPAIRQVIEELDKAEFFDEVDHNGYDMTDMPSANIAVSLSGRVHSVSHYYGDRDAPESLAQLESKIDDLLRSDQWVR